MTDDPLHITDRAALLGLLSKLDDGESRTVDLLEMSEALKRRVRGQDHVIDDLAQNLRLEWAKKNRSRPLLSALFLGGTGVGKTELCKALAGYLYGGEKNMLRFDCGELKAPESVTRLIGTPTGYVGSERGGQLTRPMLANKRRLVVFDEIEKAAPEVFDLFLSMMGDGVVTEAGSGRRADFTQAIIILTSNAESESVERLQLEIDDQHERLNALKSHLADTKVFRPEIIGRFDRVYVFKPLEGIVLAEIAAMKMENLAQEYGLQLKYVDPQLLLEAVVKSGKLSRFGVRELDRVVNEMLAEGLLAAREAGGRAVRLEVDSDGVLSISPA